MENQNFQVYCILFYKIIYKRFNFLDHFSKSLFTLNRRKNIYFFIIIYFYPGCTPFTNIFSFFILNFWLSLRPKLKLIL